MWSSSRETKHETMGKKSSSTWRWTPFSAYNPNWSSEMVFTVDNQINHSIGSWASTSHTRVWIHNCMCSHGHQPYHGYTWASTTWLPTMIQILAPRPSECLQPWLHELVDAATYGATQTQELWAKRKVKLNENPGFWMYMDIAESYRQGFRWIFTATSPVILWFHFLLSARCHCFRWQLTSLRDALADGITNMTSEQLCIMVNHGQWCLMMVNHGCLISGVR